MTDMKNTHFSDIKINHIVKHGLKRIYIKVGSDGCVTVKSPPVSKAELEEILTRKEKWIRRKLENPRTSLAEYNFTDAAELLYFGTPYPLNIIQDNSAAVGRVKLSFDKAGFTLRYNPFNMKEDRLSKEIDKFYKSEALRVFTPMCADYARLMGVSYNKLTVRKAVSRWGSCTPDGNIMLNMHAVKLPAECGEYIIVHELAHLKHHGHNKAFWSFVEQFFPKYKRVRTNMKQYALKE